MNRVLNAEQAKGIPAGSSVEFWQAAPTGRRRMVGSAEHCDGCGACCVVNAIHVVRGAFPGAVLINFEPGELSAEDEPCEEGEERYLCERCHARKPAPAPAAPAPRARRIRWYDEQVCSYPEATADAIVCALEGAGIPATMRVVNESWTGVHVQKSKFDLARRMVRVFEAGMRRGAQ